DVALVQVIVRVALLDGGVGVAATGIILTLIGIVTAGLVIAVRLHRDFALLISTGGDDLIVLIVGRHRLIVLIVLSVRLGARRGSALDLLIGTTAELGEGRAGGGEAEQRDGGSGE